MANEPPRPRRPRRATRKGGEDPDFSERDWLNRFPNTSESTTQEENHPKDADDDRILREKPPHW